MWLVFELEGSKNHLEERLLDQARAQAPYNPPFWGFIWVAYPSA